MIASILRLFSRSLTKGLVAEIADDQFGLRRHGGAPPGREIVEHDHVFAGVDQFMGHMGPDIAGAAGHEDGHVSPPLSVEVSALCAALSPFKPQNRQGEAAKVEHKGEFQLFLAQSIVRC